MPSDLFEALLVPQALREALGGRAYVQAMLDAERALARAGARAGIIPAEAAERIAEACDAALYDPEELGRAGHAEASPAAPLVARLRELAGEAGEWVHHGATSQDVVDTATMLVAARARAIVLGDAAAVAAACARLAREHRATPMAARTLLQQAVPTTFGLKAAMWLSGVAEARRRLAAVELAAQLGGAAGTLASLGERGPQVLALYAEELGLAEPPLAWHANRVRVAELGGALELVAGACGKIAHDVILLAQTEVAEVAPAAPGGSTAMPHKRNPASAVLAVAAARQAAPRFDLLVEHERAAGGWQAEWTQLLAALAYAGAAAAATRETLEGLRVDAERMRANIAPELAAYPRPGEIFVERALEAYGDG